jgi:hypothetical protein
VVEYLSSKSEALSSNSGTAKDIKTKPKELKEGLQTEIKEHERNEHCRRR